MPAVAEHAPDGSSTHEPESTYDSPGCTYDEPDSSSSYGDSDSGSSYDGGTTVTCDEDGVCS